jgi:hypothetical protein
MNFVGHAHFARRLSTAPRFVLGAMLPDLASMAGARLLAQDEPDLSAGVRDHHAVDDVFHAAPTFLRLQSEAVAELSAQGVGWGASRAVAHVAPELFLDGILLEDGEVIDVYRDAVAEAGQPRTLSALRFHGEGHRHFVTVHQRLASFGPPHGYRDPKFVGDILVRILRERPRLALRPEDQPALDALLPRLNRRVMDAADALLAEVAQGLAMSRSA